MKIDRALLRASFRSWLSSDAPRVGPYWLQWVWSFLLALALAIAFTAFGFLAFARNTSWASLGNWFVRNLIVCLTVTVMIHLLFEATLPFVRPRLERWLNWQRTVYFSGMPMLGVVLGWPLGVTLAGGDLQAWIMRPQGARTLAATLSVAMLITFVLHHYFDARARAQQARQEATEAQLRLLQAQIEPHFLFNTLANVHSLIDHDAARAKLMLASFTDYLRASLGNLRRDTAPLADELALAEAYLRVQQTRMEDRLAFRIEAEDAARIALLPPLLLQPLVENAVRHGLEPALDGGTVVVRAGVTGNRLVLEVQDDGCGLQPTPPRPGHGLALSNIRSRLESRYAGRATLELVAGTPGTLARLTLPLETAAAAAARPHSQRTSPA